MSALETPLGFQAIKGINITLSGPFQEKYANFKSGMIDSVIFQIELYKYFYAIIGKKLKNVI